MTDEQTKKEVHTTIDDKYSSRMDSFLVECCFILARPNVSCWDKSRTRQAIESHFTDNTIRDIVAYAIENEVDTVSNMICRDCFGFAGGREKCSCEETRLADEQFAAEQLRKAACEL